MKYITLFICWLLAVVQAPAQIRNGADKMEQLLPMLKDKQISLVVNHTSRVNGVHLLDTLYNCGVHIVQIFAPSMASVEMLMPEKRYETARIHAHMFLSSLCMAHKKSLNLHS